MADTTTIVCDWDGEHFTPAGKVWASRADEVFVIGERYRLEIREDRSHASHAHFFAVINEAWFNLPEHLAEQFKTAEHLRKHCLIAVGWREEEKVMMGSAYEAKRMKDLFKPKDDYCTSFADGPMVYRYTAKSMSRRAMNKEEFQKYKSLVLDYLAKLIEVTPDELAREAGQAA